MELRGRLTSSSSRVMFANNRAHSFCIPSSIVASGGGGIGEGEGVAAGDWEGEGVGWMLKKLFGAGTGVAAVGVTALFGVLNPKKPPGVDVGVVVGDTGDAGDLEGVEKAGRDAPARGTFAGALGPEPKPNDNAESGGVFGLVGFAGAGFSSIDSVFTCVDIAPNTGLGDAGRGLRTPLSALTVCSFSSSSPDEEVVASGELRVGRVLGRPRPMPKGDGATGTGAAMGVFCGEGWGERSFFSGLPGGVALSSRIVDSLDSSDESDSSSEPSGECDTWMVGTSARGVEEGDLEGGSGTADGDGDRESSSPSSSSGGASEPEPKLSDRKESPSSSSSSSSPSASTPSTSSSASPAETSTNELA